MRIATVTLVLALAISVVGCDFIPEFQPVGEPPVPTETGTRPDTATPQVTPGVDRTALPPPSTMPAPTALVSAAADQERTPGAPLPAGDWHTLVRAPGLPDMDPVQELGVATRFAVVANTAGLNTLRAELRQPANAWVRAVATDSLLVGVFLGVRVGEGHDVEIAGITVDEERVEVAVRVTKPARPRPGPTLFPVHLVSVRRAALGEGVLTFRFFDVATIGPGHPEPAFDAVVTLDPDASELGMARILLGQEDQSTRGVDAYPAIATATKAAP